MKSKFSSNTTKYLNNNLEKLNKQQIYVQGKIKELESIKNPTKFDKDSIVIYRNFLGVIRETASIEEDACLRRKKAKNS